MYKNGFFARTLTTLSNHYLDWSRVGELLFSDNHRYTTEELQVRGAIVGLTAASAMLGAYLNQTERTGCGNLTMAAVTGLLGFVVSHAVAVYPLYAKRKKASDACLKLAEESVRQVNVLCKQSPSLIRIRHNLFNAIKDVMALSPGNLGASQVWGVRQRLMTAIRDSLDQEPQAILACWRKGGVIHTALEEFVYSAHQAPAIGLRR